MSRQRGREDRNQLSIPFDGAVLPLTREAAAVIHAHLPPPILPPLIASKHVPEVNDGIPLPTPLPEAILRGVFGFDEAGEPIIPSEDEVLAITLYHSENIEALLKERREMATRKVAARGVRSDEVIREEEKLRCKLQGLLALYAEDFGETASRHLESWAESQVTNSPACNEQVESRTKRW